MTISLKGNRPGDEGSNRKEVGEGHSKRVREDRSPAGQRARTVRARLLAEGTAGAKA